jgi:hypothetical protein
MFQAGFHVNGGDPSVVSNPSVTSDFNTNLRRILGILAEALDREDGLNDALPVDEADGWKLVDLRPGTGWRAFEEIEAALGKARAEALKPYLTLNALVNKKVIRPNAVGGMENKSYKSWADIKLAHETYPGMPGTKEPGFERLPVLPSGKLVGRAPVDLAWARTRRPALIALLANLKGLYLDEAPGIPQPISYGDQIGRMLSAKIVLDWSLPSDDCRLAADRILTSTSEIGTWDEWDAFCDAIPFSGGTWATDLKQAKRDILKADFNPNSRLNKFSPNTSLWKRVDKSDLLVYSTEFSLLPQASPQDLECVGRVLGKDGQLLASRALRVSIAAAGLLTLTTQKELVCEDLGDLSVVGDEGAFRQPGQAGTPFISRSAGLGKTWGHALAQPGLGAAGASLQTFPEPCVVAGAPGTALSTRAADYDGSVQLATVETPAEECYFVAAATKDMKLLARYTADLDLDVADAAPAKPPGDPKWKNQPDVQQVTYVSGLPADPSQLSYGLLNPTRPNTLYPDGVYSERDRAPAYLDRDNANGLQGLISFWIKSNHAPPVRPSFSDSYGHRGHPFIKWTNVTQGGGSGASLDEFFYLGDSFGVGNLGGGGEGYMDTDVGSVVCFFEDAHTVSDGLHEHCFQRKLPLTPHQWSLVTMYYDFRNSRVTDLGELRVNAGIVDLDRGSDSCYQPVGNDPNAAADITLDHLLLPAPGIGPHQFVLGMGRPTYGSSVGEWIGSGADATLDEVALYDFGGAGPGGMPAAPSASVASPEVLAANRFKEGRYYKESAYAGLIASSGSNTAGEYFSPLIRLGGPCHLKAIAWTQVVPRGLKAPLPVGGQAGVDGDPGEDARILLELADASGGDYLKDVAARPIDGTFRSPAFSFVQRTVNAPFRIHAVFQPNLADPGDSPILDPLALDDVTVVYETIGGRRILTWMGEE